MAVSQRYSDLLFATTILSLLLQQIHADTLGRTFELDLELPECVSNCVEGSGCGAIDIECMCTASNGSFLPDVVVCMYKDCSRAISVDTLLDPLEMSCKILGSPIPQSAIQSAEAAESSIDGSTPTTTHTHTKTTVTETATPETTSTSRYSTTADRPSHSKGSSTLATSTQTELTVTETSRATETTTSFENTGKAGISNTAEVQPSSTGEITLSSNTDPTSDKATGTNSGGPTEQTDSSPFASPAGGMGRREEASWLGAVVGLLAMGLLGW
ncbi:uncharacterized protein BCR38DRAFT_408290 [Pseudomassariella vexata]|uniref:Uncharacterized protein n=1 Tax=Pseudomassariella vexata TaxID=1141098 RepID=A0A1Y2E645_9PEZI|nr:uncharacterized protein BCR38DRAFT_408290 [Pseudomassariella vexata]ORY66345.1 hypothetical protein BCR38DRAFT_408290 [Pseudomassariella vexata]